MRRFSLLLLLSLACARGEAPPDAHVEAAAEMPKDSMVLIDGAAGWYDRSRVLDVTGDGMPDTLQLIARGARTDSLVMTLLVRSQGDTSILAAWRSDYDFIDPPDEIKLPGPARDSTLRARYDRVLQSAVVEPYSDSTLGQPWIPSRTFWDCEGNAHHCVMVQMNEREHPNVRIDSLEGLPFDTVAARRVVTDLAARRLVSLTYSYGYESTESVVWSPVLRTFLLVFACC
jgi:hypothetical protein